MRNAAVRHPENARADADTPDTPRARMPVVGSRARKACSPDPSEAVRSGQPRSPAAGDSVPPPAGSPVVGSDVGVAGAVVGGAVVGVVWVG